MVESRQQPPEPRHHGRMTPDEMEVAIRELLEWKASIEKSGTVIIPPETVEPT